MRIRHVRPNGLARIVLIPKRTRIDCWAHSDTPNDSAIVAMTDMSLAIDNLGRVAISTQRY